MSSSTTVPTVPQRGLEPDEVPSSQLVVGQRYEVEVSDCCTDGTRVTGRFEEYEAAAAGGISGYRFDVGVFEPAWGPFVFRPVDTDRP